VVLLLLLLYSLGVVACVVDHRLVLRFNNIQELGAYHQAASLSVVACRINKNQVLISSWC
jgi:hypothetical protein